MIIGNTVEEIIKSLEEFFSRVLSLNVKLRISFRYNDKDLDKERVYTVYILRFSDSNCEEFEKLKDLKIFLVPEAREIAFIKNGITVPLSCMSEKEIAELSIGYYTTVGFDCIGDGEIKEVIDVLQNDPFDLELKALLKEADSYDGNIKIMPAGPFTREDSKIFILNIFSGKELIGFIDCFVHGNYAKYCSVRNMSESSFDTEVDSEEFDSLKSAFKFVIQ